MHAQTINYGLQLQNMLLVWCSINIPSLFDIDEDMTMDFWAWGDVLCDFYIVSQANNFDIFGASKRIFSYYIAILYQ